MSETLQPLRVLVGHCPSCGDVCVVKNNYEAWPLVACRCGWIGATTSVHAGRVYDRQYQVRNVP